MRRRAEKGGLEMLTDQQKQELEEKLNGFETAIRNEVAAAVATWPGQVENRSELVALIRFALTAEEKDIA